MSRMVGYDGIKRVSESAAEIKARFGVDMHAADGSDEGKKSAIMAESRGRAVRRPRRRADFVEGAARRRQGIC